MDGSYGSGAAHAGAPPSGGNDAAYSGGYGGGRGSSRGGYGNSQGRGGGQWGGRGGSEGYGGQEGRGGGGYGGRTSTYGDFRGGGSGGGGGGRGADWTCSNPSCGNVNFARRFECNKCGAAKPAGSARSNASSDQSAAGYGAGAAYAGGGHGGEYNDSWRSGKSAGSGNTSEEEQGQGYGGYRAEQNRDQTRASDSYVASDTPKVKQCDETCGDSCENTRIYISGLPLDVNVNELRDLFGGIGQVARIKQKRGYKDQWPWSIKLYTDESGNNKGDAVLTYEDPSAAHSAGGFFSGYVLRGHEIKVTMAEKSAPKPASDWRGSRGGGPDRRDGGGHRSRPY
ncbi:hypothetical protein O6H91_05G020300 [Diphasiastrum complanatum]|uniref:Uncharacterized protein n=1 Tax=Diphasiastrum complanatum TaxID=34168 RepID=A0ACC2DLK2_DIPCM|nr:hypothetical protein O6H91_05G020300 [Diphasiastrum complanatum]